MKIKQKIYKITPWFLKGLLEIMNKHHKEKDFSKIMKNCNGMLSATVYKKIYEFSLEFAHSDMIEIGAAHGASSISIALAIKKRGFNKKLFSYEKGEGGSRAQYGSKKDNLTILNNNIKKFKVNKEIRIIDSYITDDYVLPEDIKNKSPFSLICIDADGELIRDFKIFYDLLMPGAGIIIDDYEISVFPKFKQDDGVRKNYKTYCLVNYLVSKGLIIQNEVVGNTFFGTKPIVTKKFNQSINLDDIKEIYKHISLLEDKIKINQFHDVYSS